MDAVSEPKKARKRTSRNENETSIKKAKLNGSLEEVLERDVARENVNSDKNDTKNETVCDDRQDIFNGQCLRTLFSSSTDLAVLRKFVTICKENKERDLAAEYLLAGGSVLEVLRLLESSDKKNIANATTVFSAIHILLMRILTEFRQHRNSAIEACRYLLNSHMSIVHSMLSTQSAKQRKVVLRLLAVIASLDSSLARELLIHLSLQQQTLESLVQHTKPTDSQSVRTCFIHFVLAFLVEGNILVIRTLLDKHNLLCCIFSGLLYDSKDVVTLVLTTVKTYVLENIGISKTTKLHVFSVPTVLNLISLYNWKGPKNWSKNKSHIFDESEDFPTDKKIISDIVHEFLITLLTSHRYGVVFHDRTLGGSRSKHNQLVHTVLQNLEKPWEHEKPSDLIVRIMSACPDLIRSQYSAIESFLEPRVSPKWICLLKFIGKIVKSVDPISCIKICAAELKANNLISALLSLAVPSMIVKVAILPGFDHESLSVRHEALSLLLVMVNQLKAISLATKEFYKISTIQNQITDFILRTVPTLEIILQIWNRAFEDDTNIKASENSESIQSPELVDHLDIILSILHSYQDICPELLDTSTDLQPNLLLSSLNSLQDNEDDGETTKVEKINCMKVKTIQFLLVLDSSIFAPKERAFKEALVFLISLIRQKNPPPDSYTTIRTLLNTTGLFETCEDQLDIWINGFSVVADSKENEQLTQWFMSVLKSAIKHIDKYVNIIIQTEGVINDQIANLNVKTVEDIINELFDKTDKINPCQEEFSTESSLINGQFSHFEKEIDTIGDSFYKFNQEDPKNTINQEDSKNIIKHVKCITQRHEQVTNFDTKEIEDVINRLLDKANPKIFSSIKGHSNKILSTSVSSLMNEFNSNKKKTDEVIGTLFNNFSKKNVNPCRMQACTAVSPLLYCALQKIKKDCTATNLAYLSYVTVHTLHYQVVPDLLIHIARDLTNLPVYKYLQSWSSKKQPISLKNKLSSLTLLHKLSNTLLADSKMDLIEFSKLFNDGHSIHCFKYSDKEVTIKHSLSLYDVKTLLRMTVFYLAQLAQSEVLRQTQNENCKLILAFLLSIPQSVELNQENVAILEENARCIFTHPILLHYFSPFCGELSKDSVECMITETILKVCESVLHLYKKHNDVGTYNIFFAFRDKFLTQLRNIIERNPLEACSNNYDIAIDLLKILQLEAKDIASLLCVLMKLEKIVFISSDKENLSIFGHIVPVLLDVYCSKESRLHDTLNEQFVEKFCLHLVYLKSNKISHVARWEQALAKYLSISPHNISGVSTNTFALLLTKSITASTIQLITTLITKNTRLISSLVKYFLKMENVKQGDIVFPILGSNLKYKWNEKFLRSLYEHYSSDIAAYITEPQNRVSWIVENTTAIVYLIENTFNLALCERICDNISQNGDKLDMVPVCFVQLLESVYKRYESLIATKEKSLMDLIKVLLHIMTSTLKKESKNLEKIKVLCKKLHSAVICLKKTEDNFVFSSLSKSYSWPQFTRFSLKLGLKDAKDEETQSYVLKALSSLCDIAYGDNVNDEYTKTLFEMATSHSEFVNIMLGSSAVKGDLVELLRILTRKNHSVMTASHVPLYLAAYNATLCHVDQRILQILQYYETHVRLQQYWPYLWGSAAATRYSVKGETDTVLWRQPSTSEVFNLFNKDIVSETIKNYPIHRAMKSNELHENSNVYDPAFYLPLLCTLLAENNIVACHKMSQSGALALVLAACCSDSSDIRMTAYTIISRYYFHLEASKSKEKLLWMRLIDALRNGVISLKCPLKDVRLSCLMTTFLARTSLIASQPLHPLYSPLHTFLMAKTALDLNTIPELLQLLHSSHVEHNVHRYWILENIRDGMKEENDVNVALKCMLFKILLDFHTCALPDAKTKKLILEVIASTTRIPKASLLLIRGYGMLPWLHEIVNHLDVCEAEIKIIISIIKNLLNTLDSSAQDISHYKTLLFSILLLLQVHSKTRHKVDYVKDELSNGFQYGLRITFASDALWISVYGRCAIGMAEKLREAAAHGDVDRVARLLNENVKPLPDENGRGPLLLAAAGGHVEVCEILLLQGVDVSAADDHGNSALHEASWRGYSRTVAVLAKALGTQRAPLHARNLAGFAPLHLACQNGHNQSCRELLLAGSNPDLQNNYGDTPLHTSARYGHAGVMRILISALCKVSDQNKNGDTALHIAAAMGRRKLTRILLEAGCDRSLRNKQGETAKDIARRKNHTEILEIISKARGKSRTRSKSREGDSIDGKIDDGKTIKSDKKREKTESGTSGGGGSSSKKDRKKYKSNSKQHKVRFEKAIMGRQWSPYGCHYYPDPEAFPQPRLDSLPSDPLGRGEQYYLDLAGNIRKGPVGVGYTCYCAPFFRHMEAKLERDKAELKAHIDQAHEKLDLKVANLERRTRGQISELTRCVQEERSRCDERYSHLQQRLQRGGRGRYSERPAKTNYNQSEVILPTRTRSLEDLLDDRPQDRSFEIPGETAVHRGSLDDLDIPAIPRLSTSMRDLPSGSGIAKSALRVLDIPPKLNETFDGVIRHGGTSSLDIAPTDSVPVKGRRQQRSCISYDMHDMNMSVDENKIQKISNGNMTEWNGRRSVHEMIKRFQQVPDMHNGWRRIRSGGSEQANLDEHTKCSQNQRVHSQDNESESSEGEDDDIEQSKTYKEMNCRKVISKDIPYDSIARMPYRSRNPVYSPTPPLHDTHNDSGYSTRMYGSSKGASPSLSGQLECDVILSPSTGSFTSGEQLAALLEQPRRHDLTVYERNADNVIINIGTASLV